MTETARRHVVASGVVQGVFFRSTLRDEAERLALTGWVRNTEDGSVEAVFEGEPTAVDAAVAWTRTGPPRAIVGQLEVTDEQPEGLGSFEIRY